MKEMHTYKIDSKVSVVELAMDEKSGIYKLEHIPTGRVYVGSAVNLVRRRREHFNRLARGTHVNPKLQNAWRKYGAEQFAFTVVERCPASVLIEREQWHIEQLNAATQGFNVMSKAGTTAGYRHTQQTIDKIAKANTGKVHDDASRAKMRGRVVGEETRAKLAAAHLGRKLPEEVRASMSRAHTGRTMGEETRARISVAKTGKSRPPVTEETRTRLRAGQARRRAEENKKKEEK